MSIEWIRLPEFGRHARGDDWHAAIRTGNVGGIRWEVTVSLPEWGGREVRLSGYLSKAVPGERWDSYDGTHIAECEKCVDRAIVFLRKNGAAILAQFDEEKA